MQNTNNDYLLFKIEHQTFGISVNFTEHVDELDVVTAMPKMPEHVRGAYDYMGKPLPLYDFRKRIGLPSIQSEIDELIALLRARKKDHIAWIEALKEAVYNNREITVQTDPHQCAFGRWYDQYTSSNSDITRYLSLIDRPHKIIHEVGETAKSLIASGHRDEAIALIQRTEDKELAAIIKLFDGFEQHCEKYVHEYAVIVDFPGAGKNAIAIDLPLDLKDLEDTLQPLPRSMSRSGANITKSIASTDNDGDILIVDLEKFYTY